MSEEDEFEARKEASNYLKRQNRMKEYERIQSEWRFEVYYVINVRDIQKKGEGEEK